jgi:hypothetical protein
MRPEDLTTLCKELVLKSQPIDEEFDDELLFGLVKPTNAVLKFRHVRQIQEAEQIAA